MATTTDTPTVSIRIPTPLRRYVGGEAVVEASGATVGAALRALAERHDELKANLYTDDGTLRAFVNVYLGDEDIRYLDGPDTPVADGDTLAIVPSIAGGRKDESRMSSVE
jgi:adenylyltransferase/sulfurtransferase